MLFIHGDKDTFVPYDMLDQNYDACASKVKQKRTIHDAAHAKSAQVDPELYWNTVNKLPRRVFLGNKQRLGFVAKTPCGRRYSTFPRTSEKPPVSAVLASGFCSNYATKALILSNS